MKRCITATALLCCAFGALAQIYKCPDANGRTIFQQDPCEGGKPIKVDPPADSADTPEALAAKARLAKLKHDNDMRQAIREHYPLIGMTEKQLLQAMGAPNEVNTGNYSGTRRDQIIWRRPDATWYVYTENGVVESIQTSAPSANLYPRRAFAPARAKSARPRWRPTPSPAPRPSA